MKVCVCVGGGGGGGVLRPVGTQPDSKKDSEWSFYAQSTSTVISGPAGESGGGGGGGGGEDRDNLLHSH